MPYTYKDGYREGVAFIFIKDNMVLVEERPISGKNYEVFFTSGSIEDKDYSDSCDYKVRAMFREVSEEFEGKVKIINYKYLDDLKVEEINVIFYIYLITEWEGQIPEFTIENGEKFSRLQWINLNEKEQYLEFDSAFEICRRIENYIFDNKENNG
ncbi:hypothetical protein [Clostridium sp.]|uniref:hypothetical protein n=1 Tax=Clostridium sp. TaxID=1506 RepID=UPI0032163493